VIICILHVYTQNAPGLNRAIAVALNLSSVEKGDRELQCTRRLGTLYGLEDKLRVFYKKKKINATKFSLSQSLCDTSGPTVFRLKFTQLFSLSSTIGGL